MRLRSMRAAALASAFVLPAAVPLPILLMPTPVHAATPDGFADLAATLSPAVVNISSVQAVQQQRADRGGEGGPSFPPGSPFEQFFRDFLDRNRPNGGPNGAPGGGNGGPQRRGEQAPPGSGGGGNGNGNGRAVALGSGFIIDNSGLIVTNNHVIEGADEISVTLTDGTTLKAKLLGKDEKVDLALLKVETTHPLSSVPFGDSDTARVGDWVLAIGNPFGLGGSVTAGIVSARGRDIRQSQYDDFIQTDAPINRGNSGGPLFNMRGEVIGINTAINSPSGGSVGIGFSVPANLAKLVIGQLREYGHARRGFLGVSIQQVTPDIAESLGLHDPSGALVGRINDDGPASKAGIRNGDVILKFNNQDIKEMKVLPRVVAETEIGKSVPVLVWRDGKQVTLNASVGELPEDVQQASATATVPAPKPDPTVAVAGLGAKLAALTDDTRSQYKLGAGTKGVVVTEISPDGNAANHGLKPGDVIVEVQQQPVSKPSDVADLLQRFKKQNRKTVLMLVQSGDGMRWVPLPLVDEDPARKPG